MEVISTEKKTDEMPQEMKDGFRILARIIAREFLKSQSKKDTSEVPANGGNQEHLQHQ